MQGNFSRRTFDPQKHYIGVLMQQGRVQLDADWNEQQAIQQHRIETEARDIIGACGTPLDNDGFKITTQPNNVLAIGKGHYYVDGILCENDREDVTFFNQPYKRDTRPVGALPPDILQLFKDHDTLWGILYLDVWQRHITALDDPSIREKALNGPDTATRLQTIWQVGLLLLPLREYVQALRKRLQESLLEEANLEKALRQQPDNIVVQKQLLAVKEKIVSISSEIETSSSQITCHTPSPDWDKLIAPSTGMLNARTLPQQAIDDPCILPPSAGYQRLDNQLYRVEVHRPGNNAGNEPPPTFKWSRENGSVVTTITKIIGRALHVHDLGPDEVLGFHKSQNQDQWIEIIDDEIELKGLPGQLVRITDVDETNLIISVSDTPLKPFDEKLHPKIRRWDQSGVGTTKDGIVISAAQWIDLEGGIQVQFSQGTYKTGDYWLIPARTATGNIEWPGLDDTPPNPQPQACLGIVHHYCHLAMLVRNPASDSPQIRVRDCRKRFPSLASLAMHVTELNWSNDDRMPLNTFLNDGLRITLDANPDPKLVKEATMIVTLEVPFQGGLKTVGGALLDVYRTAFILHGNITVSANVIQWRIPEQERELFSSLERLPTPPRIRVTLKGHSIWSTQDDKYYYLDGQSLGLPALQADKKTPRIDLTLPTGLSALASDFESWFYISEQKEPLQVRNVRFLDANLAPVLDGSANYTSSTHVPLPPLIPNVSSEPVSVNTVEITFNRPIANDGVTAHMPQCVSIVESGDGVTRIEGNISFVDNRKNVIRFNTTQGFFVPFSYVLTVFGQDQHNDLTTPVKAGDDGSLLNGNFDGTTPSDFVQPFTLFGIG